MGPVAGSEPVQVVSTGACGESGSRTSAFGTHGMHISRRLIRGRLRDGQHLGERARVCAGAVGQVAALLAASGGRLRIALLARAGSFHPKARFGDG